jgi:glycosyltransferase involved in cell wall biosynthesis/thymidylate kinase
MDKKGILVEFIGLPGSGKSTLNYEVAEVLKDRGIRVESPTMDITKRFIFFRVPVKLYFFCSETIFHPFFSLKLYSFIISTEQKGLNNLVKVFFNLSYVVNLIRRSKRNRQISLLDQGIIQALYSIIFSAGLDIDDIIKRIPELPLPDLVVSLQVSKENVLKRINRREYIQSRIEFYGESERYNFLEKAENILNKLESYIKSNKGIELIELNNNTEVDLRKVQDILPAYIKKVSEGRKYRVLHLITRLDYGGADENTIYTINGLDSSNYDLDLMIGEENNQDMLDRLELKEGIGLIMIPGLVRDPSLLNDLRALINIYRLIKRNRYDIVHTHIAKAGVLGRLAARMAGTPIIIHGIHGITFPKTIHPLKRYLFLFIERFCGKFTDFFIPVGEDMRKKYLAAGIGKPDKYRTIYSGMELERFLKAGELDKEELREIREGLGINNDEIVIGNVSKIQERKGFNYFLEAAKKIIVEYDNVRFIIVGNGPDEKQLKERCRKMGLDKRVIFTGYCRDVENMFAIMDIKVLTSLWEGLPRVLVQAAAVGKPMVSFDVDGAWEIIKEGVNGYIVPIRDVDALVDRIKYLIDNQEIRKSMGKKSRELLNDSWNYRKMVAEIEELYQELIKSKDL